VYTVNDLLVCAGQKTPKEEKIIKIYFIEYNLPQQKTNVQTEEKGNRKKCMCIVHGKRRKIHG
jgi:hypothetical protein